MSYKPTILYVEDEDGIQKNLSRFLRYFSSKLFIASDGLEGLEVYKQNRPDIVITDIRMPKMDGIDMVQEIKKIDPLQIIIFLTAFNDSEYLLNAINLSVDSYILKPVDLDVLENKLVKITDQLNIQKELDLHKQIINEIAELPEHILMVFNGNYELIFSNKRFLDFFDVPDIEQFYRRYNSIQNLFLEEEEFFYPSLNDSWIEEIQRLSKNDRIVSLIDQKTGIKKAFLVSINETLNHTIVLFIEITTLTVEKHQLRKKAFNDELTGVYNRAFFNEALYKEVKDYQKNKIPFSCIMFDIDHFKTINDTYGHQIGDEILKELSSLIKKHIRTTDIFARWGGEEFIIILPATIEDNALLIAEFMRKRVKSYQFTHGLKITCSFGVVQFNDQDSVCSIVSRVDQALYSAKKNGRDTVMQG